jgi:hypothetical protein
VSVVGVENIVNRSVFSYAKRGGHFAKGRLPIGRRLPTCPTKKIVAACEETDELQYKTKQQQDYF